MACYITNIEHGDFSNCCISLASITYRVGQMLVFYFVSFLYFCTKKWLWNRLSSATHRTVFFIRTYIEMRVTYRDTLQVLRRVRRHSSLSKVAIAVDGKLYHEMLQTFLRTHMGALDASSLWFLKEKSICSEPCFQAG